MKPGDKVVCIDDSPCRVYKIDLGIKKNQTYVISGTMTHNGKLFLYLVGFNMPNTCQIFGRRTFRADRFRLLDELKQEARERQQKEQHA